MWHHAALRRALFIAVLLGGCQFGLKGVDPRSGGSDASNGGKGGDGATGVSGATRGQDQENGGGSGGGAGRVWLRTPATAPPIIGAGAMMSPSPTIDASL